MSQNEAPYEYTKDETHLLAMELYNQYIQTLNTVNKITHNGTFLTTLNIDFKNGFIHGVKFVSNFFNNLKK